jgi:hypothetical protein
VWVRQIDNSRETIFKPRPVGKVVDYSGDGMEAPHPYEVETRNFEYQPWQLMIPKEDEVSVGL